MSYVRWSSDSFRSDLYVYADVNGGYTTHIASNRKKIPDDLHDPMNDLHGGITYQEIQKLVEGHKKFLEEYDKLEVEDIDLPHAGESFNDATLQELKERLLYLQSLGYHLPSGVIEEIEWEINEQIKYGTFEQDC